MRIELPSVARILAQHRFFSACVILSLGIGTSSAAGVIAIVDSVRHGALPFRHADRVEHLFMESVTRSGARTSDVPAVVYRSMRAPGSPAEDAAAYSVMSFQVRDRERLYNAWGAKTTANFPTLLGSRMTIGRAFDSTDTAEPAVMLGYQFWRSELGADSTILGRTIELSGVAHRIVGVAAPEWDFPEHVALWASSLDPAAAEARQRRLSVLVRLKAASDQPRARAQIVALGNAAIGMLPRRRPNERLASAGFRDFSKVRLYGVILILTIISVFVGFLTAVNFAALILARGIRRRGEVGVRAALGASVARLARHIIGESLLLCALGGLVASLLAPSVVEFLRAGFTDILPAWLIISLSWRAMLLSASLSLAIGVIFAIGPALDIARPALAGFLRAASSTVADGGGLSRTRGWLVGIQVALATAVLIALGALMGRSMLMRDPTPGFDDRSLIVSFVSDSGKADDVSGRMMGILSRVQETPGVAAAAFLDGRSLDPTRVTAETGSGSTTADAEGIDEPWLGRVGEGFFGVMRPAVIGGRLFTADEEARGAPVAVLARGVAHRLFGDAALGKRIRLSDGVPLTIVGVIDDIRLRGFQPDPTPAIFTPMAKRDVGTSGLSVRQLWTRASGPVPLTVRMVQSHALASEYGTVRMMETRSLAASMAAEQRAFRSIARLTLAIFGVALGLAALGIYGLVAYTAEMRSREFAIREALGASRSHVARLVLRDAFLQAIIGAAAGALVAIIVVDYLNDFQLKLTTAGGATVAAFAVVSLTVILSSIGPLRAAWRRDLSAALRA